MVLFTPNFKPTTKATFEEQIEYLKTQQFIDKIVIRNLPNNPDNLEITEKQTVSIYHKKQTFLRQIIPPYVVTFQRYTFRKRSRLTVYGLKFIENKKIRRNNPPIFHIYNNGEFCLGDANPLMHKLTLSLDITGAIFLMREYVHSCIRETITTKDGFFKEDKLVVKKFISRAK